MTSGNWEQKDAPEGHAVEEGYTDSTTGLVCMWTWGYDPATGQFLTQDSLWPLTTNPCAHVADNPLNALDPLGLWAGPQCISTPYRGLALAPTA